MVDFFFFFLKPKPTNLKKHVDWNRTNKKEGKKTNTLFSEWKKKLNMLESE